MSIRQFIRSFYIFTPFQPEKRKDIVDTSFFSVRIKAERGSTVRSILADKQLFCSLLIVRCQTFLCSFRESCILPLPTNGSLISYNDITIKLTDGDIEMLHSLAFGFGGPYELLIIAAIILLLFGKRLPSVMGSLGKGIVEFKKGVKGIEDEVQKGVDEANAPSAEKQEHQESAT